VLAGLVLLAAMIAAYYLLAAIDLGLGLWTELQALPLGLGYAVLALLLGLGLASAWLIFRLLRAGPPRAAKVEPIDRAAVERRVDALPEARPLQAELVEIDRRRDSGEVHVALFGEVSTGKSSLLRALAPQAEVQIAASGGTTRQVAHAHGELPDGRRLVIADVPGSNEADGEARGELARDEAARAHALLFVVDGDLTRHEDRELRELAATGRPLLLALNQSDRYRAAEREMLRSALRERYAALGVRVVSVSAGHTAELQRELPDGRRDVVLRERPADIGDLQRAIGDVVALGAERLEPARERASLQRIDQRLDEIETRERRLQAEAIVRRYTRRAMVGAMAAVAPGTDILIQGALASAMVRELAAIYGSRVREIDLDGLLSRAGKTVRSQTAIVLAIAGNALKAFPGLGTLGGGLVHTLAYGLIFDSLGRALSNTLEASRELDRDATLAAFRAELERPGGDRLQALARIAYETWRDQDAREDEPAVTPRQAGKP